MYLRRLGVAARSRYSGFVRRRLEVGSSSSSCRDDDDVDTTTRRRRGTATAAACSSCLWQSLSTFSLQQRRHYHSTERREILPLVLATVVLGGGYYSYRAIQRMNTEWEDYQWALKRYEKEQLKNSNINNHDELQSVLAIDLGTAFGKLATRSTHPPSGVEVVVSREGDRSFFNGVVYDHSSNTHAVVQSRGRTALERFYFQAADRDVDVTLPFTVLTAEASGLSSSQVTAKQVVSDVLTPALTEVMDRMDMVPPVTTADDDDDSKKELIRKVITVPSAFLHNTNSMSVYETAFEALTGGNSDSTSFVPEPVAACWGAQFQNILPDNDHKPNEDGSYLVIDIGGWTTQVAVVRRDVLVHAATVPWGGEIMVEQLVDVLKATVANEPMQDARSLALLQMQARNAASELAVKTRVAVHVPYIFDTPGHHHLDTSVARSVFDQAVQDYVRDSLVEQMVATDDLSPHMPPPVDLTSLWTSVLTQVLEQSATLPAAIDSVLLVGGGAKSRIAQETVGTALQMLMGSDATNKLKRPDPSVLSELTVLGAATLLPSFGYSVHDGLVRRAS